MHLVDLLLTVQRVTINANLGVQAVQVTGWSDNQRVNLNQRQIALLEQFRQAQENLGELTNLLAFQA